MAYKRKSKQAKSAGGVTPKNDNRKNPTIVDTSMGEYWLKMGKVRYLKRGEMWSK